MTLATILTERVEPGRRLREVGEAQVSALMESIGDVGLLNPITVYPRKVIVAGVAEDGFGLVAGAHRLEACKRLGLAEIAAQVVNLSELERQIAECDENLCASQLSPSERARFTARRKEAYEALHPETRATMDGGGGRNNATRRQLGDDIADRFTVETAARTGKSERVVQRDAERGAKVSTAALAMVKGTDLDTGKYLDTLKRLSPEDQVRRVKDDLRPEPKPAPAPADDADVHEQQVSALMKAWNRAGADARRDFIARIDVPVFDR